MADLNLKAEYWAYMGARRPTEIKSNRAKIYAWLDGNDKERFYEDLKGTVIGGIYEIEVDRSDPGSVQVMASTRKYTGDRFDHDFPDDIEHTRAGMVAGWRVMDTLANESIRRERLERKHKGEDAAAFEEAVAPLRKLYNVYCHTRGDRHAFQAMVLAALNGW